MGAIYEEDWAAVERLLQEREEAWSATVGSMGSLVTSPVERARDLELRHTNLLLGTIVESLAALLDNDAERGV